MSAAIAQPGAGPVKAGWLKWAIALTVSFAAILQIIDVSIVNVSLPQMQGNLGATVSEIGWVITGYAIANAIVIPLMAFLGGAFGQKQYFIFSLTAFVLASVMCGLATTLPMLIFARVLQGLFGGGLLPRAQSILFEMFPPEEYGIAQAVFGIGVIVGPTFAPTLGGYLTDTLGWRWVFFINVPVGAIAILMAMAFLPSSVPNKSIRSRIDWIGIALLAVWLGSFQTFLEEGQNDGWFQSDFIVGLAIATVLGFGFFIWREMKIELPAVDLRVLRHKELTAGSIYSVIVGITLFGTIFVIPLFTQNILHFSAIQSGELLIPGALMTALMMPLVGLLLGKTDARLSIAVSSIAVGISMFMLAGMNINSGYWAFFWPLILRGMGMGLSFAPLSVATLGSLPKKDLAAGTGLFSLFRQIGGSVGVAMMATILEKRHVFHYDRLVENINPYNPVAQQYLERVQAGMVARGMDPTSAQQASIAAVSGTTHVQALILSFGDIYILVAWLFLLSIPLVFFLGKGAKSRRPGSAGPGH